MFFNFHIVNTTRESLKRGHVQTFGLLTTRVCCYPLLMVESTQRSEEISMGGRVKTASKFFGQVFVYKILSKSPMYHKSKQPR